MNSNEPRLPHEIETRSFEIITEELGARTFPPDQEPIVKRCIHTSADFDYADNLCFSPDAVAAFSAALRQGAHIVTDTQMVKAGINKAALAQFGGQVHCFIADQEVAEQAKARGVTRSYISMERATELSVPLIFAIGNAPTALLALWDLMHKKQLQPKGIIAVPVGFVNVVESKERILQSAVPHIVARGRKGGSNIAAAICNAILYQL